MNTTDNIQVNVPNLQVPLLDNFKLQQVNKSIGEAIKNNMAIMGDANATNPNKEAMLKWQQEQK